MNKKIPTPLAFLIIFLVIAVITGILLWLFQEQETENVVCTQEVKLCPDGSYVNRAGPDCEFTECLITNNETVEGCTINPFQGEPLEFSDIEKDVRGGAICHFYINNNLPIYN